jgi:hypothetical protein
LNGQSLGTVVRSFLFNLGAVWSLIVFVAAVATLGLFFYSVFLRKIIRAKSISSAHMKRMLREAAERESEAE